MPKKGSLAKQTFVFCMEMFVALEKRLTQNSLHFFLIIFILSFYPYPCHLFTVCRFYTFSLSLSHSLSLSLICKYKIYIHIHTYADIQEYIYNIHIIYVYIYIYILDCAFSNCMQLCDSRCTFLESRWPWCRNQTKTVHGQCVIKCKHNIQLSNSYI